MKACKACGVEQPLEAYYANRCTKDGRLSYCKPCHRARYAEARSQRAARCRALVAQIKVETGCADCGFNAHPAALDFDHLPGTVKHRQVGVLVCGSRWSLIQDEIAKCEVVCVNCHRIRTAERLEASNGGSAAA